MRAALLCLLLAPVLCAMDAEGVRFARRTLLNEPARKHLKAEVGDMAALTDCTVLKADFDGDGKPDEAALVRGDLNFVLAFFPGGRDDTPAGVRLWTAKVLPAAAALELSDRACVRLQTSHETTTGAGKASQADWTLLRWHNGTWHEALAFTHLLSRTSAEGRVARQVTRTIEVTRDVAQLVETSRDLLDGKLLEGSATRRTADVTTTREGRFALTDFKGPEVPVATRAQIARTLEREGLLAPALEQAAQAVAQAERENLAANDARLLDARALQMRLAARLPGPTVAGG